MSYSPHQVILNTESVLGATPARSGWYYFADPSGGDFTITLPAAPDNNAKVNVKHVGPSGIVTVNGNGKNIDGESEISIQSQYDSVTLIFSGPLDAWFLV